MSEEYPPARIGGLVFLRPNASTMTHEELDAAEGLDAGALPLLVSSDSRHVAALWGVSP